MVILGALYFQTVRAIEKGDINEAKARAERLRSKRMSNELAGV